MPSPYVPLAGGVDQRSGDFAVNPGRLRNCKNFEIAATGKGYRWPEGYERSDGQVSPSAATYTRINFDSGVTEIAAADEVTDSVTGATGICIVTAVVESGSYVGTDAAGYVVLLVTNGSFAVASDLEVAAAACSTATDVKTAGTGAANVTTHNAWVVLAVTEARGNITAVGAADSCTGSVLGVHRYNGVTYAFRNNSASTYTDMYKQTVTGWEKVSLGNILTFDTGSAEFAVGETVTDATATATIRKVIVTSGAWSGTAAGFLVIGTVTGGPFSVGAITSASGAANSTAAEAAITITKDGRFECKNYNFGGHAGTYAMYGANGVSKAFEYDGTAFTPITTGMTDDSPNHIAAHLNHLFLTFPGGSVQHSSLVSSPLTAPFVWSAVLGASQRGIGDNVTGIVQTRGDTLTMFAENLTKILFGSSTADWNLQSHDDKAGAVEHTIQTLNEPIYVDAKSITSLSATEKYGALRGDTISSDIQDFLNENAGNEVASAISLKKNQYILFYSNDKYLTLTITKDGLAGYMFGELYDTPTCACYDEQTGEVFFGSDDGFVYEMYKGTSHDGEEIKGSLTFPFNFLGKPDYDKEFHKLTWEVNTESASLVSFDFFPAYDYRESGIQQDQDTSFSIESNKIRWDSFTWDNFYWDASAGPAKGRTAYIDGVASEVELNVSIKSATQEPFTLNGYYIDYTEVGKKG